jgi:hypothetical protein
VNLIMLCPNLNNFCLHFVLKIKGNYNASFIVKCTQYTHCEIYTPIIIMDIVYVNAIMHNDKTFMFPKESHNPVFTCWMLASAQMSSLSIVGQYCLQMTTILKSTSNQRECRFMLIYHIFVLVFTICQKYDIFNGMPRKLLHYTGSSYVSQRKRLYHLPETVISPMPSNPSYALIVHFQIRNSKWQFLLKANKTLDEQISKACAWIWIIWSRERDAFSEIKKTPQIISTVTVANE